MRRELKSLQSLRGIAVLLVVLLHVYAFEKKAGVGPSLLPGFSIFGSSGVDLFFVISGFVMVYTTLDVKRSFGTFGKFLYKRATRIYPLYWIVTAVLLLGYIAFPQLIHRTDLAEVNFLKAILLFPQENLPYVIVGWTLIHELYFYAAFSFFVLCDQKKLPYLLITWLILVICLYYSSSSTSSSIFQLIAHPLTFEFILGCFAGLLVSKGRIYFPTSMLLLGSTALLSGWYCFHAFIGPELYGWSRAILLGVPYSIIVYGASSLELRGLRSASNTILLRLGDASYSIYLLHFFLISLLTKVWSHLFPALEQTFLDNITYVLLCFALSCGAGVLSFLYLERPIIRASRSVPKFISGRRLAYRRVLN